MIVLARETETQMKKLSGWLTRISKPWLVIAVLVIFVLFLIFILPAQPKIGVTENHDPGYPDLAFWYSTSQLYDIAEIYGPEGRMAYVRMRYRFDLVWPLVYVAFLAVSLSWLLGKLAAGPRFSPINLLPVFAGFFDLLENLFASIVMLRYPDHTPIVDVLTPLMTMLKWSLISFSFLALLAGLAVFLIRSIRRQWNL